MPTINLNRKEVESLLGKKINETLLKEKIEMLGAGLDNLTKDEIIVEISPNRPDLLSEQGFARALSSFLGIKKGLRKYTVNKSYDQVLIDNSVKTIRPYTVCAVVKDLKFDDQKIKDIIQAQEKLHITFCRNRKKAAIGIYPCEKIKFPIRYLAKSPEDIKFIPLESRKELNAKEILELHPAGKEYGCLLKDLKKYPIFIDTDDQILSMPPIINSELTGKVSEETSDVFIECSGFDLLTLNQLLNIIVCMLADMGGTIYSLELKYGNKKIITPNLKETEIKLDLNYANKILGLNLKENIIKKLLPKMGFDYKNKKVIIPAYRTDILHQIDIVEDLAIAYGYENFKPEIPNIFTIAEEDKFEIFKRKIAKILVGFGFIETSTYHLSNKENQCKKMNMNISLVEIENSKTQEYNVLRAWITPSLIEVLAKNKLYEYPQRIFEIGNVFNPDEISRLGVLISHKQANFTEIKQILDYLLSSLGLNYEINETKHDSFIEGRIGRVLVKGNKVAYIGEINPLCLEHFNLEMPVVALELNLTEIFKLLKQ